MIVAIIIRIIIIVIVDSPMFGILQVLCKWFSNKQFTVVKYTYVYTYV